MSSWAIAFGPATQYTGSIYFLVTRLLASGVRLYATCMAVSKIMDWPLAATIALFTVVSILFIAFGGIKAVVWAGAYEALFFVVAGTLVVGYLLGHIDGGVATALQTAHEAGRLSTVPFPAGPQGRQHVLGGAGGRLLHRPRLLRRGPGNGAAAPDRQDPEKQPKDHCGNHRHGAARLLAVPGRSGHFSMSSTRRTPLCRCRRRRRRSSLISLGRSCPRASKVLSSVRLSWRASIRP